MIYEKLSKNQDLQQSPHGMQEVARSTRVGSIVVSYAEYDTYVYLPCGSAVVTLWRKAVIYSFWKERPWKT